MKVIPDIAYNNGSYAEQKFFDALKRFEVAAPCVAFHSIMLTNHAYKRIGEADFVLVGHYGVFVIEVKGGRVSQKDGRWFTTTKKGTFEIDHPFKQVNSAMHALNDKISGYVDVTQERIPLGYGVAFPDVVWVQQGAEWESEIICDSTSLQDFACWLTNFFTYWHKRPANSNLLSDEDVNKIINYLRPNYEFIQPLFAQVREAESSVIKLTKEQYHYVDMAMDNKRVICSGGAGTGKTFLAAELCRRFIAQGRSVLLTCHSSWLRHYLGNLVHSDKLVITTISSLSSTMRREDIEYFDVVIIDEGQDILNLDDLYRLDKVLEDGFDSGQWYFFHDSNNQSNILSKLDKNAMAWLESKGNPAIFKLNINCRNTGNIASKIQSTLHCDIGKPTLVEGPEVTEFVGNSVHLAQSLSILLKELKSSELNEGSITILSSLKKETSLLSLLDKQEVEYIVELDDYKVKTYPFEKMTYAQIANFKGLENDVIILLDLEDPSRLTADSESNSHYVGMSRARAKLYCFWNQSG